MQTEQATPERQPNERLREERERRGWSQAQVAEKIDAPGSFYVSRWERGKTVPSPHYRARLCALFEKDAYELGLLPERDTREIRTMPPPELPVVPTPPLPIPPLPLQSVQQRVRADWTQRKWGSALLLSLCLSFVLFDLTSSSVDPSAPISCSWPLYTENVWHVATDVTTIQLMLEAHGYSVGSFGIDGSFGPYTKQALRSFQADNGLPTTGTVNSVTWQKLIIPSQPDSAGNQVKALQVQLNAHGTRPPLPVTGIFAQKTEEALHHYLQQRHLPDTGTANLTAWCSLVGGRLLGQAMPYPSAKG